MLKKCMALILSISLIATMLVFPAITASAEVIDITDYVPLDTGTLLDGKVIKTTSYTGASYDYGVEIEDLDDNISKFYNKAKQGTIPSAISRPAGGLEYTLNHELIKKDDKLVFIIKVRKVNEDDVVPNLVFGVVNSTMGGSAAGWGWKAQNVYTRDITSTDWQTIVQEITIPYNGTASSSGDSTVFACLGLGVGNTRSDMVGGKETSYKGRQEFEFRPGAAVEIDMNSVYLGKLTAYDINFDLSASDVSVGQTVTGEAAIVDRIGQSTGYDQNFTYYVTDEDGNTVDGFEITEPSEGKVSIKAGSSVTPGKYVAVAVSDVYPGFKKTSKISVTYGDVAKADGTQIKVTASGSTTVGVTDNPVLSASVIKDGSEADHSAPFTWTAISSDKMEVCTDITFVPSDDTKSAKLSLSLSIAEGSYYIMVNSDGMCTLFEITVDKSGDIENIATKIKDKKTTELIDNMETYLKVLELSDTLCVFADASSLAAVAVETVAQEKPETLDLEALKKYFTNSAIVTLYEKNESSLSLYDDKGMFVYADELELSKIDKDGSTLWTLYGGKDAESTLLSDEGRLSMQASLADGAPYESVGDFKDAAREKILLYTLAYPNVNSFGYVSDVLTEKNIGLVGIDADAYLALADKSAANEAVAGTLYTASELAAALKKAAEDVTEDEEDDDDDDKEDYKPSPGRGGSVGGFSSYTPPKEDEKEESTKSDAAFADISEDHWACTDIYFLKEIGVVNGTTETTFEPDGVVTREQFLKMLVLAFKVSASSEASFTDVSADAWYAQYVSAGVGSGIINGMPDGSFGAGQSITRQDACVMLARALGLDTSVEASLAFDDAAAIAPYAINSVGALTEYAIINGFTDNTFRANEICSRAQAAKIVSSAITIFNSIKTGGSN